MKHNITVIMGIYNCEETLSEAIDSILNQTYGVYEIIMCDDGSKDNTLKIAKEYQKQYPDKIILLENNKNMGLNFSLNCCLAKATGEYIARMDGDDISLPERFEEEIHFFEKNPECSIVSSPMIYFDENGDWGKGKSKEFPQAMDFVSGTPFCHAPCLVKKDAYDMVNGYSNDPRTLRAEDYDLWFRMYAKGLKGGNLQKPMYKMRDDSNAYHRRKFRFCINEAYVKFNGYRMLKLPLKVYPFALRPIIVGMLPKPIYMYLHHKKRNVEDIKN